MSIITLQKFVKTRLTPTEIFIIDEAFKMFVPKYKDMISYTEFVNTNKGHNMDKYIEFRNLPHTSDYERLKKFFGNFHDVVYNNHTVIEDNIIIKMFEKEPDIIIDILTNYLEKKKFDELSKHEKYNRTRKEKFVFHIYKQDVEGLITGMKEIKSALKSRWVDEVDYEA